MRSTEIVAKTKLCDALHLSIYLIADPRISRRKEGKTASAEGYGRGLERNRCLEPVAIVARDWLAPRATRDPFENAS